VGGGTDGGRGYGSETVFVMDGGNRIQKKGQEDVPWVRGVQALELRTAMKGGCKRHWGILTGEKTKRKLCARKGERHVTGAGRRGGLPAEKKVTKT